MRRRTHAPSPIPTFHGGQCRWQVLALRIMPEQDTGDHLGDDCCSPTISWGQGGECKSPSATPCPAARSESAEGRLLGCLGSKRAPVCVLGRTHCMQAALLGVTFLPAKPPDCWASAGVTDKDVAVISPSGPRLNSRPPLLSCLSYIFSLGWMFLGC